MVIVFDLNGTLLDLHALAPHIRHIFGRKLTVDAFFTQVIQYSMALTLAGDYQEFGDIAISVLEMAATANNVKLTSSDIEMVRDGMQQLLPFATQEGAAALAKGGATSCGADELDARGARSAARSR